MNRTNIIRYFSYFTGLEDTEDCLFLIDNAISKTGAELSDPEAEDIAIDCYAAALACLDFLNIEYAKSEGEQNFAGVFKGEGKFSDCIRHAAALFTNFRHSCIEKGYIKPLYAIFCQTGGEE
jgi:hypothetical protein